jgi:glycosyltransferase involved in cell wall biosynthesis
VEGAALLVRSLVSPVPPGGEDGAATLVVHPGAELYGSDRMLLESVSALTDRSRRVTVALPGDGPLVAQLRERGARVVFCRMPVLRKSALRPAGAVRLLADAVRGLLPAVRLVRRHRSVYVSTLTIPSWLLLARLLGRPALCHVHEAEASAPRLLRHAMAVAPRLARRVVVNSSFSLGVLTDVAPGLRDRSRVVYNGVAGPDEVVPARAELAGQVRLLFVGRLSPRKGPQVAVSALAELVDRGVDARLELLGSVFDGYEWFEEELRATVRELGLGDRVEFLGFRPVVWPTLAMTDVVLIPSIVDEPFGNTAVEAVLAARPVVVSDTSGLREAVAGYASAQVVEPGATVAWADAVERVIADWPRFRDAAVRDAAQARDRHSPAGYRRALAEEFTALSGGADPVPAEKWVGQAHAEEAR